MRSIVWKTAAFIYFIFMPISVLAVEEPSPIDQLSHLSDEALQLTKSERYEDAKKLLDTFSNIFSHAAIKDQFLSMDEIRIVTIAHNEAVAAVSNVEMDPEERVNTMTKLRLVIDALSSTKEPLWTDMKEPILDVFYAAKEAALNGEKELFYQRLDLFLSYYDIIYPSMKIDLAAEQMQQIDARVKFVDEYRAVLLTEQQATQEFFALETDLQAIFDDMSEDEADPSLWWVIISTGSIIVLTLSYVGWRKFKGEREKRKTPSR